MVEEPDEALQQKIQGLGYLVPPKIEGEDCEYVINSRVPKRKREEVPPDWFIGKVSNLEAAEHEETARFVELFNIQGEKLPVDEALVTVKTKGGEVALNFSNIIALAGDFYTNREGYDEYYPIANVEKFGTFAHTKSSKTPLDRFESAVNSLLRDTDGYLKKVRELITTEHHTLHAAIKAGDNTAVAYHDKSEYVDKEHGHCHIPNDEEFTVSTEYGSTKLSSIALKLARTARAQTSDQAKMEMLRTAYIHEAFAAHFLTDLFSSGHLRAPRRAFHNPDYKTMGLNGWLDNPVWDFQCRFESVAEVFRVGYQGERQIEDWEKNMSWFTAMQLLPKPMTAIEPQDWMNDGWSGYDKHNPAPLWIALHNNTKENQWTVRKDLDDHSNYGTRRKDYPGNLSYGQTIKSASFVTKGQFAMQSSIDGLRSGGFIQIQDLDAGDGKGPCINFWAPARVKFADQMQSTFTIRNRLIDQDIAPRRQVLHWMRSGARTGIIGLTYAEKDGGSGDIEMQETDYQGNESYHGPSDGTCGTFSTQDSWAMRPSGLTRHATILSDVPAGFALNLTRFIAGYFISTREIVAVSQSENQALIGVLGDSKVQTTLSLPKAPYGFVKPFNGAGDSKNSILMARAGPKEGSSEWVNLAKIDFDDAGNASLTTADFELDLEDAQQDASVLVGDAMGWGYDQAVVVKPTPDDRTTVAVYGQHAGNSDIKLVGLHQCETALNSDFVGPLLTALVPSVSLSGPAGQDLLHISRRKSGSRSFIGFHTHAASGNPEDPFHGCVPSEVEDALATRSPEHYFSIKWMPVQAKGQALAVLEVFSWYGVLGVRVFALPQAEDGVASDWMLLGQLPHLGQTSIGAGLGCYGDWGHGFVTWSSANEWTDANVFRPQEKSDLNSGWWGMVWEDCDRQSVRGWDVEKRPLR
ncbi:hypothetical protein N0V90_000095 [Kalmusia sp. IMI 367209]|nr:hypothetical protein N0V90_000095 [Kalmusia sp. IMI 367209]